MHIFLHTDKNIVEHVKDRKINLNFLPLCWDPSMMTSCCRLRGEITCENFPDLFCFFAAVLSVLFPRLSSSFEWTHIMSCRGKIAGNEKPRYIRYGSEPIVDNFILQSHCYYPIFHRGDFHNIPKRNRPSPPFPLSMPFFLLHKWSIHIRCLWCGRGAKINAWTDVRCHGPWRWAA